MKWHLIEGAQGCAFAVEHRCVAIIVDALRASATAAMCLHEGASGLVVVQEVADAFAAQRQFPDALLFGERGGLPPEGFDAGNSPRDTAIARGREVIFTTTTGAGRMVAAWGAQAVYMGTTVNATAVADAASRHGTDVVLIPAGLSTDPTLDAQEDWAAAAAILLTRQAPDVGEGRSTFEKWARRIETEGILQLFMTAPHADKLRAVGLEDDIPFCAQVDITNAVPQAIDRVPTGLRCRPAT